MSRLSLPIEQRAYGNRFSKKQFVYYTDASLLNELKIVLQIS